MLWSYTTFTITYLAIISKFAKRYYWLTYKYLSQQHGQSSDIQALAILNNDIKVNSAFNVTKWQTKFKNMHSHIKPVYRHRDQLMALLENKLLVNTAKKKPKTNISHHRFSISDILLAAYAEKKPLKAGSWLLQTGLAGMSSSSTDGIGLLSKLNE